MSSMTKVEKRTEDGRTFWLCWTACVDEDGAPSWVSGPEFETREEAEACAAHVNAIAQDEGRA